jgi:hypothetical protein
MSTAGSTRLALTEEQRQQIIAKLLAERRSQAGNAGSRQQAELPQEQRAARLQELFSRRAAAKQQQGEPLMLSFLCSWWFQTVRCWLVPVTAELQQR